MQPPHFVKIEYLTARGWETGADHARLSNPERYANRVVDRGLYLGCRITDHDTNEVWRAGLADGGLVQPPDDAELNLVGVPAPGADWDDVLGDPQTDTESWDDIL